MIKWSDGRTYDEDWVDNIMEGFRKFMSSDGKYYIGEYKDDKKENFGELHWKNWKQNKENKIRKKWI